MTGLNVQFEAIRQSATVAMGDHILALKASGREIVGLQVGDPDFATPAAIVEAAASIRRRIARPSGGTRRPACQSTCFASMREVLGRSSERLSVPVGTTAGGILERLVAEQPKLDRMRTIVMVAVAGGAVMRRGASDWRLLRLEVQLGGRSPRHAVDLAQREETYVARRDRREIRRGREIEAAHAFGRDADDREALPIQ